MSLLYFILASIIASLVYLLYAYFPKRKAISNIVLPSTFTVDSKRKKVAEADYSKIFPPSQRHTLAELLPAAGNHVGDLAVSDKPLLELEADYRLADPATNIYSGFTVDDVRALGNFPDYATLSGVPAPTPLKNFNIKDARPRPYRPLRWPYHQTMCTFLPCQHSRYID